MSHKGHDVIYVGNGARLPISHIGYIDHNNIQLKNVLIIVEFKKNLFFVGKFILTPYACLNLIHLVL